MHFAIRQVALVPAGPQFCAATVLSVEKLGCCEKIRTLEEVPSTEYRVPSADCVLCTKYVPTLFYGKR